MQQWGAMTIGEKTEVANTYKTGGQDMQQKTTEKLIRLESHGARLATMGIASPTKSDSTISLGYEPGRRHQFALGEPGVKRALAGVAAGSGIGMVAANVLTWPWAYSVSDNRWTI